MSFLDIRLFGRPEISFEGKPWRLPTLPKTVPLMAQLALHAGSMLSRSALAVLLWPDDLDEDARTNLRRHLHRLTKSLPAAPDDAPWIVGTNATVGWNANAPATIDVVEFERLAGDRATARAAIDLYRGDFLQQYEDDEWIHAERERLRAAALGLMQEEAASARVRHDFDLANSLAQRMLEIEPWREDALRTHMAVLYETGDRDGALDVFDRFTQRLHDELRVDPMPETLALRDAIAGGFAPPPSPSAVRESRLPFVGRDRDVESLRGAWRAAAQGRGATVFLSGEAGVGKSRLAAEFAATVETQGGRSLVGTTSSHESQPYQPIVEALRHGLAYVVQSEIDPLWLSVVSTVLPEVRATTAGLADPPPIDPKRAAERLHEAFVRLFEQIARTRPLVVIFEDLHWAHTETIEAIDLLARRAAGLPLLLVLTYRAEGIGPSHPLRAVRRALSLERLATTLSLARLSRGDIERLLSQLPDTRLSAELAEPIYRRSEGNALFAWQLVRGYLERGELPADGDLGGVGEAIAARIGTLEPAVREVSQAASTVGRSFTAELVAEAGDWETDAVLDALGELIDRHLVREASGSGFTYEFSHGLIADAIYTRTPADARIPLHRRIARAMETASRDDRASYTAIARHWKLGGEPLSAADAFARAARSALDVYARAEAIEDATESLELGDPADVRARFETLRTLVKAEEHYAPVDRWKAHLDEFERCAALLDGEARYAALQARERYFAQTGERDRQREVIDEMLAIAAENEDTHAEATALLLRGELTIGVGAFAEARDQFHTALAAARDLGDRRLIVRIRQRYVDMLMRMGETELGERELEEQRRFVGDGASLEERLSLAWTESAIALAIEVPEAIERAGSVILELGTSAGDIEEVAKAHWLLGSAADLRRETTKVRFHYGEAAQGFERLRQPHSLAATLINLGVHEIGQGMMDRAVDYYRRGAEFARKAGSQNVLGFALANIADTETIRENWDAAYDYAKQAKEVAQPTGDRRLEGLANVTLGKLLCRRGEIDAGLELMREAIAARKGMRSPEALAGDLVSIVEVLVTLPDRREELGKFAAELETSEMVLTETTTYPSRAYLALAKAADALGDAAKARRFRERGLTWLRPRLRTLDTETAAALRAMPWNQELLAYEDKQAK